MSSKNIVYRERVKALQKIGCALWLIACGALLPAPVVAMELNHAPDCSGAQANVGAIWPPDHKFTAIDILGITDPDGDAVEIEIQCIIQDEELNAPGDGNFVYDGDGIGTATALVRNERAGGLNGRVYHIDFIAADSNGARCGNEVTVAVNHTGTKPAIDDGRLYQSVPSAHICGLHDINNPPVFSSSPALSGQSWETYHYDAEGHDPDHDVLTYSLKASPAGMSIDPASGLITWTAPAPGLYSVVVQADDGRGGNVEQSYDLFINGPPILTSTPVLLHPACSAYAYRVTAIDPNNDVLEYSLTRSPQQMSINPATGLIDWENPLPGEYEITVKVADNRGGAAEQSFMLTVRETELHITSEPVTSVTEDEPYIYTVRIPTGFGPSAMFALLTGPAGMAVTGDAGVITWRPDPGYSQGIVAANPYCAVALDQTADDVAFADVVAIVDESGSMAGEHLWIAEFGGRLEQGLAEQNIGEDGQNRYGLVGFERYPREIPVGGSRMGSASEFVLAADYLRLYGGIEDGWRAIKHVVDTYPLRDEGVINLILVTDEDRDNTINITYTSILTLLRENDILLNAVVNARFSCGDGRRALGMDYAGTGYVADGSGGYATCNNAKAANGDGATISHYVNLALATGGAAWDLAYLRSGGHWAQSFSTALIDIKVKEIVRQTLSLADVTPTNIRVDDEQSTLSVDIVNRGGGDITVPMSVLFFSGLDEEQGVFLGKVPFAGGIAGNSKVQASIQVGDLAAINDVFVRIDLNGEAEECHAGNNSAAVPIVGVEVSGECNASARQFFAVNVFASNLPPQIQTTELPAAEADVEYAPAIEASDPNAGDSVSYSLEAAPHGMTINNLNGRIHWLPDKEQQGDHDVIVKVRDIAGLEDMRSYIVTVY